MPDTNRAMLILAGGAGTRLWPLSTDARPKQFLRIFDGESLIQKTFSRLEAHTAARQIFVSTNESYRALVEEQLPSIPRENILVEPARRNTAPAIAACCAVIERRCGNAVVGIFPSDHSVGNNPAFREAVSSAFEFAANDEYLCTIGIHPTAPETGFGYLELGSEISSPVFALARFVEKPSRDRAEEFIASGRYLWNGGMFIWRLSTFFEALSAAAPEIAAGARRFATATDAASATAAFSAMPSISIDYALMEKAQKVATVRGDFDWSDVGSWAAVAAIIGSEPPPDTTLDSSERVFVHASSGRPIAVVGAKNLFVIDSPDGLLVMDSSSGDRLSGVVKRIQDLESAKKA